MLPLSTPQSATPSRGVNPDPGARAAGTRFEVSLLSERSNDPTLEGEDGYE